MSYRTLQSLFIAALASLYVTPIMADAVNVNLSTTNEIQQSLKVSQKVAEDINLGCQYQTCRSEKDLMKIPGVEQSMLNKHRQDVIYSIMERGMSETGDF